MPSLGDLQEDFLGNRHCTDRARIACISVLSISLLACDGSPPPEGEEAATLSSSSISVLDLPFSGAASDVLVEDFDGDGRLDLAFTSHGENFTQVFYQREARLFEPGPPVESVGYHPGNLVRLPLEDRASYLMSAEGEGRLLTMEHGSGGGLDVVAEARVRFPRFAATFDWPGWGMGIAVAPFSPASVILLKNYDPHAATASTLLDFSLRGTAYPLESMTIADLNGDGADEIILPMMQTGTLRVIRYPGPDAQPEIETLWDARRFGPIKHVVAVDVNGDGLIDLIAPEESPKPDGPDVALINILINDGEGGFDLVELPFPAPPRSEGGMPGIRALDAALDRDGLRYVFASGYDAFVLFQLSGNKALPDTEFRRLALAGKEGNFKAVLKDVDGDGWLDAVVARGREVDAGLVIFGPLWEYFTSHADEGGSEWNPAPPAEDGRG
jgi:hypothetical protein